MRKLNIFSFIVLALVMIFCSSAIGQDKSFTFKGSIRWDEPKELYPGHTLLYFDGAVNHDSLGFLPVYLYNIPADYNGRVSSASLWDVVYEPLNTMNLLDFPDLDLVRDEPVLIISTSCNRKVPVQSLYLMPIRKAAGKSGYERLVSFTLKFDLKEHAEGAVKNNSVKRAFADNSVLRSGDWYRIAVTETGIYRISYDDLAAMGINPDNTDPRNIRLFGNGSGMLPESNSLPRKDDLMENAIFIQGEDDGVFNQGDYILFYGEGPVSINYNGFYLQYEHEVNFYTDETYYFLTTGDSRGTRVKQSDPISMEPTSEVYNFEDLAYHEKDSMNLIKSGKMWYGEVFNSKLEYDFLFNLSDLETSEPLTMIVNLAGRSTSNTLFNLFAEGSKVAEIDLPSITVGSSIYARAITSNYETFYATDENVNVGIEFVKPGSIDIGWLNFIELNFIRKLKFNGGQLSFRDMRPVGPGNLARYHIQASAPGLTVWEVSDPGDITAPVISSEQTGFSLKMPADTLCEFIAFDGTQYFTPLFIEKVANQNLHGIQPVDLVIVTYPPYADQALRLASYHEQWDNMTSVVVTPQQIYNEFSSGAQDVSAIRDFMKMLYDRAGTGSEPRYLLLFGDASYDYKNITSEDNNLVPAYESRESLRSAASFVTDDFFGCLDEDEGSNGSGTMDIGIGRFPVKTEAEAVAMVDKTFRYMMPVRENFGPWRNSLCYIADDEDNNIHLGQAEGLVEITDSLGPVYNVNKIYLDAYLQMQTPSGTRYPDANKAIDKNVNDGCLIINYTGHGGETGWATERVLDIPMIQAYKNISNMPAFVTATCEFSRYDDPGLVSAGELVMMNPDGGGIGLFTTTRLAYSQSNYSLNKRFYYEAFVTDSLTGEPPRMGDLIRVSKTPSNQNIKNFVLLGDPALMLAYPKWRVRTDSIIDAMTGLPIDTLHALSKVTIKGHVENLQGVKQEGYYGELYPSVYDKPVLYKTRGNDATSKIVDFYIQDKVIYKGKISISAGEFSFTFVVPLDISYQYGAGKISYYAVDTVTLFDANGYDPVWIGGSDSLATADETGPEIYLYLNTFQFKSGDLTTPDPLLIADLYDWSGINTVGNGIGHDLTAILDNDYQEPILLNDYFIPETDSYQQGRIFFQLGTLSNGTHTLTLKAWDVLNNSSEKTIEFRVDVGARLSVSNVYNYPNPYSGGTSFVFDHNKPGSTLKATIRIFNLMGQQMTALQYTIPTESTQSGVLYWNGLDDSGNELPAGIFVYRLLVESDDGYLSTTSQKLLHYK
jgi:hypothetical protein